MDSNSRDAMASMPQSRNRLENGRGKNNEVSGRVWKAVEAGSEEVRLGETERGRREAGSRKEKREKEEKQKNKREERQWR